MRLRLLGRTAPTAAFTASLDTSSDPTNDGTGIIQPQEIEMTGGQAGTYAGSSRADHGDGQ